MLSKKSERTVLRHRMDASRLLIGFQDVSEKVQTDNSYQLCQRYQTWNAIYRKWQWSVFIFIFMYAVGRRLQYTGWAISNKRLYVIRRDVIPSWYTSVLWNNCVLTRDGEFQLILMISSLVRLIEESRQDNQKSTSRFITTLTAVWVIFYLQRNF